MFTRQIETYIEILWSALDIGQSVGKSALACQVPMAEEVFLGEEGDNSGLPPLFCAPSQKDVMSQMLKSNQYAYTLPILFAGAAFGRSL